MTAVQRPRSQGTSLRYDRDELLARTDLAALADELLGGHVGHGRSAKWPSPVPDHPQTGKSPPMSIFRTRGGEEHWKCFATGESGSAIDLVMVTQRCDVRTAIEWLAGRAGVGPSRDARAFGGPTERYTWKPALAREPELVRVSPKVEAYVRTCERLLWSSEGARALEWLTDERGFSEGVLHANRVGFDPGPAGFVRPKGLPRLGPAVVLPALNDRERAVYFQARYLDPRVTGRKYDNPPTWMAPNPKLATMRGSGEQLVATDRVIVTEGIPDALAAVTAGFSAVAILGTGNTGLDVAQKLTAIDSTLVIVFDGDNAGRKGGTRLMGALAVLGRTDVICCDELLSRGDLNEWIRADPSQALRALKRATGHDRHNCCDPVSLV